MSFSCLNIAAPFIYPISPFNNLKMVLLEILAFGE